MKYYLFIEEMEKYKILSYPGIRKDYYEISNKGNVRRLVKNGHYRYLKTSLSSNRYLHVALCTEQSKMYKYICIHRLVAWEFCKGYNETFGITYVNHKNSDKLYNYYENLEWVTCSDNIRHSFREGCREYVYHNNNSGPRPSIMGSKNPNTKFDEKLIHTVCILINDGYKHKEIYNKTRLKDIVNFSNANSLIKRLKSKKSWVEITNLYF